MAQSYSKFTYEDLNTLGLDVQTKALFPKTVDVEPSAWLKETLQRNLKMPMGTEKSKSEHILVPILNELVTLSSDFFTYFSGYNFDVDKARGLKGHCDFLLSTEVHTPIIKSPVVSIVEAKHENIEVGIPQCIAQMYAAQLFNHSKNNPVQIIHGCVTFGFAWSFLRIENKTAYIDTELYYLNNLPQLLGVWKLVIDFYRQ